VPIYRYKTGGRTVYQMVIPGAKAPDNTRYTTTNKKNALAMAITLANAPAKLGTTLAGVSPALLEKAAESIVKLEPVLAPLGMSVVAGLEEYANLKARTGKLVLPDLVDGILKCSCPGADQAALGTFLYEVAIAKLVPVLEPLGISIPGGIEEYAAVKAKAGAQDLREIFAQLLSKPWVQESKTPIVEVLREFLKFKKDDQAVTDEYYKGLYYMLNFVVERLESGIAIGAVTTEMLRDIIFRPEVGPWSKRTYRTNVRTFFKWCQHHLYLDYAEPTAADRLREFGCRSRPPGSSPSRKRNLCSLRWKTPGDSCFSC